MLCSWARHFTLTVPLSATSSINTVSRFMLKNPEISTGQMDGSWLRTVQGII